MKLDDIKVNIKRFFSNPNTLTFILVIVLIVIVYFFYNYLVKKVTSPISVPYATQLITPKSEINTNMVATVKISGTFTSTSGSGLAQTSREVINRYVADGFQIPKYSFFYTEALTNEEVANDTAFTDLPDNYTIYRLDVDFHSTYGCSIMPGNYIDLYIESTYNGDTGGETKVIFEPFIKSIRVEKVVNEKGNDIFSVENNDNEVLKPTSLYFSVPIEYYELLKKSEKIRTEVKIIPVPRNAGYSENPDNTEIVNDAIIDFIEAETASVNY